MKKPNFFIVGAAKCGTTSLYRYLRQHPDVFMPQQKEPNFFGSDLSYRFPRISKARYLSCFARAKRQTRIGEATTSYLYSEKAAEEIKEFSPGAKIIIMLRNPVDVLYSYHSQQLYSGNEDIPDFEEALRAEDDRKRGRRIPGDAVFNQGTLYREIVRFADQVERYFDVFGRENVHIVLFDDFVRDTEKVYRETLEFLGLDPEFRPVFRIFNTNRRVRFRFLRSVIKSWGLRRAVSMVLPRPLLRKIYLFLVAINTRYLSREPMDPELRRRLQYELRDEVDRLERLLGRDLSHWTRACGEQAS